MADLVSIEYAELHTPLFLGGKNFGTKLEPHGKHKHAQYGLSLEFDESKKRMLAKYLSKTAHIPEAAVAYWIPGDGSQFKVVKNEAPPANKGITAQVSTPQSHVQAGPGFGKVGK